MITARLASDDLGHFVGIHDIIDSPKHELPPLRNMASVATQILGYTKD